MIRLFVTASPALKLVWAALVGIAISATTSVSLLVAQVEGVNPNSNLPALGAASASSIAVAALVYVVRLIASGQYVHRDAAAAETSYENLAQKATSALEQANHNHSILQSFLVDRAKE